MNKILRLLRLTSTERHLLVHAMFILAATRLGFYILPFQILRRLFARIPQSATKKREFDRIYANKVVWSVNFAGRYVRGARCLERAIAGHLILARAGYGTSLCIGLRRQSGGELEGHAWIEADDEVILGGLPSLDVYCKLPPVKTLEELVTFFIAFQLR